MAQNDRPYVKGQMDIRQHTRTFEGFWSVSVYTTIALIGLLVLMAAFLL